MNKAATFSLVLVLALSAACEAKIGKDEGEASGGAAATASAEGKAEENTFSMKASGIDIKVAIPEGIRSNAQFDSNSDILYPDASFSGIHVEGERGGNQGGVEIRFTSATAPDRVTQWYRDAARKDFTVESVKREGDAFVIAGKQKDGDDFTVRLTPKANGGTDGRLGLQTSR